MSMQDQAKPQGQRPQYSYTDRPELEETFADHVRMIFFDGQTLRIEFCITRFEEPKQPPAQMTGRRYPSCRLVLSPAAAIELMNQMQRITASLVQQGVLKAEQQAAKPVQ